MSLLADGQLAQATNFTLRLQVLLNRYAKSVIDGTATNGQAQSPASKSLAYRIQQDPGRMAGLIAMSIVSDAAISGTGNGTPITDSSVSDTTLDGVVQSLWNAGYWFNIV